MIDNIQKVAVASPGSTTASIPEYVHQHHALILVRHLIPLIIAIQQHRGASLALLEGDESFHDQVHMLRQDVSRRFDVIRQLNTSLGEVISDSQCHANHETWEAFISKWREDGVIGSLDFHNALVERLLQVVWQIVEDANYFYPTRSTTLSSSGVLNPLVDTQPADTRKLDHQLIARLVTKDIPLLIENIAKARGLSVHLAVHGRCEPGQQVILNQLLQTIGYKKEKIRTIHRGLHKNTLKSLPALMETLLHEHKLNDLLLLIKGEIMVPDAIGIDSHMLFRFATEIIEIYSAVIDQGLDVMQRNLDATLIA